MAKESKSDHMPIPSILRLLILTTNPELSPFPSFLNAITGTPPADVETFAGYTTHPPLKLRTKYYAADVNIWCDELPTGQNLSDWQSQMLSGEAREVRDVLGGIIVLLPFVGGANTSKSSATTTLIEKWLPYLEAVASLRDEVESETGREIAAVFILQEMIPAASAPEKPTQTQSLNTEPAASNEILLEKLEDTCMSERGIIGWDMVSWQVYSSPMTLDVGNPGEITAAAATRNTYGEKTGIPRVIEALESVSWPGSGDEDNEIDHLDDVDQWRLSRDISDSQRREDEEDIEQEQEILGDMEDEEFKVEQLVSLLDRAVAIRDASADMSPSEREKFAKREVAKIMDQL